GAAAHVEQAGIRADARGVEDRLEQRLVVRFGQVRPGLRIGAPQAALDLRGRAEPGHSASQGDEAGVHAVDDVVVLMDLDRVAEQRATVVPGDVDRARAGGVDQAAAQPGQAGAFCSYVGHDPGHVADRARSWVERGRQAVVDRVDLVELDYDRTPRGKRGRVVEHD